MDLLISLASGALLIALVNGLLTWLTPLSALQSTLLVLLATLALYFPSAILYWQGGDVLAIHLAFYLLACALSGLYLHLRQQPNNRMHWAPTIIIAFFAVLFVVDSVFIVLADRGPASALIKAVMPESRFGEGDISMAFPGTVYHDFQEKEAIFNTYLEQRRRQEERGWQVRKGWLSDPRSQAAKSFQVEVVDRVGAPVTGATVTGTFLRPADQRLDHEFAMDEVAPGRYRAELMLPAHGRWDLVLLIDRDGDLHEVRASTTLDEAALEAQAG